MSEDLSPAALPFSLRVKQLADSEFAAVVAATQVFYSVDLAKRMLLELKVREFTAADVVALAGLIEARNQRTGA